MKRLVLYLVLLGVILLVVKAIAPLIILGVIGLVILAWRRPQTVERLAARPQLARVPALLRATPMRFAASVAATAAVAVALSMPMGASADDPDPSPSPSPIGESRRTDAAEPSPTVRPTPAPTARPTATPEPTPEPTPVLGAEPTGPMETGTVVNVVDGDTIDVVVDGVQLRVRYIGMDTPEVHSGLEWLGPEASAANAALVAGKEVVLERDVSESDRYGRALRYVWVDDGDGWLLVNLELIRLGLASVTTYPPDVKYVDALYLPAQDRAQADGLGMWGAPPTPVPTPLPAAAPAAPAPVPAPASNCEPSYPDICVQLGTADLDCADMYAQGISMIRVRYDVPAPDPHRFDGQDNDGWGCEG